MTAALTNPPTVSPGSRLDALAAAAADVAHSLKRSVVSVRGRRDGGGAGMAWRPDLVITNNHVAPGDEAEVATWDDRVIQARVVAHDPGNDLAALRLDSDDLPPVQPRDSDTLRVGEVVVAVGHPWGQRNFLTSGIVFSKNGTEQETRVPLEHAIRADLALAPGNSGGPLADADGRVVGVNAMIVGGMAIAIPSNTVEAFVDDGLGERGIIGIVGQPVEVPAGAGSSDGGGLIVTEVREASPAELAGVIPGDILIGLDDVSSLRGVATRLQRMRPGRPVQLTLLRGGGRTSVSATPLPENQVNA
jgi:serine protease Do